MEPEELRPEIADLAARLERISRGGDDTAAVARVRRDLESRVAVAPRRRFHFARGTAWLVAAAVPLAAATAVAVSLLGHPQANRLSPLAHPSAMPVTSPVPTALPTRVPGTAAPLLVSIRMFSESTGWGEVAGIGRSIARTTDGGRTWRVLPFPGDRGANHFVSADEAWVATGGSPQVGGSPGSASTPIEVDHTTDGGMTWTHGNSFTIAGTPTSLQMIGPAGWFASEASAPGRSADVFATADGVSWTQVTSPPGCPRSDGRATLTFGPDRRTGLLAGYCGGASPVINVTHDGARTWITTHLPAPPGYGRDATGSYGVCGVDRPTFFDIKNGLVSGACGFTTGANPLQYPALYVTADGGVSWTLRSLPEVGSLQMASATTGYLVGVSQDYHYTFYRTRDGGRTWSKPAQPPFLGQGTNADLDFIDAQTGWALVIGGKLERDMWLTRDGGGTWADLHTRVGEFAPASPSP